MDDLLKNSAKVVDFGYTCISTSPMIEELVKSAEAVGLSFQYRIVPQGYKDNQTAEEKKKIEKMANDQIRNLRRELKNANRKIRELKAELAECSK